MKELGIQMYSFMDGVHNDWRENIRQAKNMGYDGVELFAPCFDIPAEEMKELLEELDLKPISLHEQSALIVERTSYAEALGMKYIGIGMEILRNEEEVHEFAKKLNSLGRFTARQGLTLTYHNHTQEFAVLKSGKTIIETLMEETDPNLVGFELDAGWCAAAGTDPEAFIKTHGDRIKLVHVKESSRVIGPQPPMDFSGFDKDADGNIVFPEEVKERMGRDKRINCVAGAGLVDWKRLQDAAKSAGCHAKYIVEREFSEEDRVHALALDLEYYRKL